MKTDRLVGIIMTLLAHDRIGAQELANRFEVSPRTIYRDVDAISMAGIPIRAISGVGGGFEILPEYKVDKKVFSSSDLSAILTGLSSVSGMLHSADVANALAKVESFIPAGQAEDIACRAGQIHIDVSPWMGSGNAQPYLQTIKTALQEQRLLRFSYADRHGNKTTRIAEPYQLVLKGHHWYWQGYCRTREDFRLFKLSRTSHLQIQAETFPPRAAPKPQLEFTETLAGLQTHIQLRIHASALDRMLDFCDFEHCTPDGEDHYLVRFPFIENDYYYGILLSLGNKCECLAPAHIRAQVGHRAQAIAALYKAT